MEQKTKIGIGLFAAISIGGGLFALKDKIFGNESDYSEESEESNYSVETSASNQSSTNTNSYTPPTNYSNGSFPLQKKFGYNPLALELQQILNAKFNSGLKEDGYFGGGTETALQKATGKTSLSESEFNALKQGSNTATNEGSVTSDNSTNISLAAQINADVNEFWGMRDINLYQRVNNLTDSSLQALAVYYKNAYGVSLWQEIDDELPTASMIKIQSRLNLMNLK